VSDGECIDRLVSGAGEETVIARVGEGMVSSIGSATTHKSALENQADAFRQGHLGIMDYYRMQNLHRTRSCAKPLLAVRLSRLHAHSHRSVKPLGRAGVLPRHMGDICVGLASGAVAAEQSDHTDVQCIARLCRRAHSSTAPRRLSLRQYGGIYVRTRVSP